MRQSVAPKVDGNATGRVSGWVDMRRPLLTPFVSVIYGGRRPSLNRDLVGQRAVYRAPVGDLHQALALRLFQIDRPGLPSCHRVTEMNPGQGFVANFVTAGLVIGASWLGLPDADGRSEGDRAGRPTAPSTSTMP